MTDMLSQWWADTTSGVWFWGHWLVRTWLVES